MTKYKFIGGPENGKEHEVIYPCTRVRFYVRSNDGLIPRSPEPVPDNIKVKIVVYIRKGNFFVYEEPKQ